MTLKTNTGGTKDFVYSKEDLKRIQNEDTESSRAFKEAMKKWRSGHNGRKNEVNVKTIYVSKNGFPEKKTFIRINLKNRLNLKTNKKGFVLFSTKETGKIDISIGKGKNIFNTILNFTNSNQTFNIELNDLKDNNEEKNKEEIKKTKKEKLDKIPEKKNEKIKVYIDVFSESKKPLSYCNINITSDLGQEKIKTNKDGRATITLKEDIDYFIQAKHGKKTANFRTKFNKNNYIVDLYFTKQKESNNHKNNKNMNHSKKNPFKKIIKFLKNRKLIATQVLIIILIIAFTANQYITKNKEITINDSVEQIIKDKTIEDKTYNSLIDEIQLTDKYDFKEITIKGRHEFYNEEESYIVDEQGNKILFKYKYGRGYNSKKTYNFTGIVNITDHKFLQVFEILDN